MIAALQALGGTPTVTLKTTHKYYNGTAAPAKGAQLGASPRSGERTLAGRIWPWRARPGATEAIR